MERTLEIWAIYRHFKGKRYKVITTATNTETGETLVIYEALYDEHHIWARPYEIFMSEVDKEKYPNCSQKLRFEKEEN